MLTVCHVDKYLIALRKIADVVKHHQLILKQSARPWLQFYH